ncbi:helix-turn-helix domain-containing protein [Mediterraneibacter gnavus]|uniref:helix-turn-helix domain-containing protein n=1 Tax=Mediterraneibacter gnavus TaxID=33038 RepID=UPI000463EBF0|nr:helix-turn-helix domain-containing protein [Mediterraneibacter gnavus]
MNTIAERIKFAMKAKNKKQVDIVKDTGISKGAFSSYLSGQYNPKADKMELIADSLDVDLRWLYGQNVPMEHTSQNNNALQYVFYNNSCSEYLLDNLDDIYIAMMTQYAALIPRFYVLVNRGGNAMHILPLFLKEDSSQFYECPSDFFYSDRHTIFTRDFESIHMVLTTATIYYYGIDTKTYEPKVTKLSYSQADDCFYIDNGIQDGHIKAFEKEVVKEALYLKNNAQ